MVAKLTWDVGERANGYRDIEEDEMGVSPLKAERRERITRERRRMKKDGAHSAELLFELWRRRKPATK
jgi:hypothetical protein